MTLIKSDLPCPCGDGSSSYAEYQNGGFCFKCEKSFPNATEGGYPKEEAIDHITVGAETQYSKQYLASDSISKATLEWLNCPTLVDGGGKPYALVFPFGDQARSLRLAVPAPNKYHFEGDAALAKLAFMDKFPAGSAKAVTIYEGAKDAASAVEIMGRYPSVAVRSASTALKECQQHQEYLNSFEKIILCLDNDEPGQKAAVKIAKLFNFDKVYNVKLPRENGKRLDVNDMLKAGKQKDFTSMWWNAKKFVPEGILSTNAEVWELITSKQRDPLAAYPWPTLQDMTYGLFSGQFVVIKAPTKIGKTEFISHIEYEVLKSTDHNIGVIHIEDRKDITPKRYATYELGRTCHLPDSFATNDEIFSAYQNAVKRDSRVYYYSHFGSKDPEIILDTIRYLVTVCGCKFIFLDHITLVISGLADDDERRALDRIATSLATMTNDLDFCCVAISHVNDNGQSRGSRTIEHTAHTIISLQRDKNAEDDLERNTTRVTVEGNRICGLTGPAGKLIFNRETWRLTEPDNVDEALLRIA